KDERNWFTILHLHGLDSFFDLADRYPVHAVNWHDRETSPSITEAMRLTDKVLVAGIHRGGAVTKADAGAVAAQVRDAIAQSGGRRLVVAPGCVIPAAMARVETLRAARDAVQ
ncbi:MAG: uroporphyrinogen decarboxylase family protein, partial [Chloroflexota bacterium]